MTVHRPGLALSDVFYHEAVLPILAREYPWLAHSAARLGTGSEVLGFDTSRSMDHEWGPRLQLFLREEDETQHGATIAETLRNSLPREIAGFSTHFAETHEPGVSAMRPVAEGPIAHKVEVTTLARFLRDRLGIDSVENLDVLDWLTFSEQALLEVTAGALFHDGLDTLEATRRRLAYYPDDVWRYLLAAQWTRISQQEPFVGRTGEVGDDLGSRLIAAALVRDAMRLAFLMERRYAPYSKWFGSAFARLSSASALQPHLDRALAASDWQGRETHLVRAYERLAAMHNTLGLTAPLPERASQFHNRPFTVIHGEVFADAILAGIEDARVRHPPYGIGSVDQMFDSTDVLSNAQVRRRARALYED